MIMENIDNVVLPDIKDVFQGWVAGTLRKFLFKLFHSSKLLTRVQVFSQQDGGLLVLHLHTEYERVYEQQRDRPISHFAIIPWYDEPTPISPTEFVNEQQEFPMRSTATEMTCPQCQGSGSTTCTSCGGAGYTTSTESYTVTDSDGNSHEEFRTVEETCMTCGGTGHVTCSVCNGEGRVVHYISIIYQYVHQIDRRIISSSDANTQRVKTKFERLPPIKRKLGQDHVDLDWPLTIETFTKKLNLRSDGYESLVQKGAKVHEYLADLARSRPGTILFDRHDTGFIPVRNINFSPDNRPKQQYQFSVIGTREKFSYIPPKLPLSFLRCTWFALLLAITCGITATLWIVTSQLHFVIDVGIPVLVVLIGYLLLVKLVNLPSKQITYQPGLMNDNIVENTLLESQFDESDTDAATFSPDGGMEKSITIKKSWKIAAIIGCFFIPVGVVLIAIEIPKLALLIPELTTASIFDLFYVRQALGLSIAVLVIGFVAAILGLFFIIRYIPLAIKKHGMESIVKPGENLLYT